MQKLKYKKVKAEVFGKAASGKRDNEVNRLQISKLQISKFNAGFTDWPKFWNLYSEIIHKSSVPAVSKCFYLKELLC